MCKLLKGKKDTTMEEKKYLIIEKLFKICHEIETVARDSEDSYHKKPYVSDAKTIEIFKPLFKKYNLFFVRSKNYNVEKEMYEITMTFYDVENKCSFSITDDVPITQRNTQGYGALITYLTRYFNLELFFVQTVIDSTYETVDPVKTVQKKTSAPWQK